MITNIPEILSPGNQQGSQSSGPVNLHILFTDYSDYIYVYTFLFTK